MFKNRKELEHWQELEDLRFRASLVQMRIQAGLSISDLKLATGSGFYELIDQMEDIHTDPHLSTIRRYCKIIGAYSKFGVGLADIVEEGESQ